MFSRCGLNKSPGEIKPNRNKYKATMCFWSVVWHRSSGSVACLFNIYREKERESDLPFSGSLSGWLRYLGLGQAKARSQELRFSRSPTGTQPFGPSCTGFSRHIRRVVDGKWSSWDTNQQPYGMPASQAAALPTMPQLQHQHSFCFFDYIM